MKWVTRARPKTDRIACPWLIRRFIDSDAEILYVPADQVLAVQADQGAIGFDAPGAHDNRLLDRASFVYDALYAWCAQQVATTGAG